MQERAISQVEAEALREYMIKTGSVVSKRCHRLIIDACGVTDETFSLILDGLYRQSLVDPTTKMIKL